MQLTKLILIGQKTIKELKLPYAPYTAGEIRDMTEDGRFGLLNEIKLLIYTEEINNARKVLYDSPYQEERHKLVHAKAKYFYKQYNHWAKSVNTQ